MSAESPNLRAYSGRHGNLVQFWGCTVCSRHRGYENRFNFIQVLFVAHDEYRKQVPEIVVTICRLVSMSMKATPKYFRLTNVMGLIVAIEHVHSRLLKFRKVSNE